MPSYFPLQNSFTSNSHFQTIVLPFLPLDVSMISMFASSDDNSLLGSISTNISMHNHDMVQSCLFTSSSSTGSHYHFSSSYHIFSTYHINLINFKKIRARNGITKPKFLIDLFPTSDSFLEPSTVLQALSNPNWKAAMDNGFQAHMGNQTWTLVPYSLAMHVFSNKWVFRTKFKADGKLDKFKTRLLAKGFQQTLGGTILRL